MSCLNFLVLDASFAFHTREEVIVGLSVQLHCRILGDVVTTNGERWH